MGAYGITQYQYHTIFVYSEYKRGTIIMYYMKKCNGL